MDINNARRIVAFVETWGQSYERLAGELGCSEPQARLYYAQAKSACNITDARATVAKLNELAASFNISAETMLSAFAEGGRMFTSEYWRGYRVMKRLAYDYYSVKGAFTEIYQSNASNEFVRGAERARRYIERVGLRNLTA